MLGGEIRQGPIKVKVIDLCKKCAKPKTKQGFAPVLFTLHCKCVQGVTVIHRLTLQYLWENTIEIGEKNSPQNHVVRTMRKNY